ncbi:MAG: tRNA pseudouridine(55) synthase TruB [Betaproteobacteria bacterium]|jgi:tRNA pseudouridine55 synthase|uniref:tRNA pseudouridine synthase B n=1 Tax=Thiomonas delicata TaxID=364030 RepID=A0A238D904_THIDL|nr:MULTISPECIES: tRNA pseudouridine(55) synthase TruB [Thiomonas]MDE2128337.1 tRNA pseudouridine(55) synthase TruB [Betaproteobacteria bacterium]OZB43580.1 MAG: tRNA pseudouridine(55) synthase TruB [Thiomonas sp. 15-66-11]OZB63482.1 MAG: tRNA pseudouridine(55) synthase TruB [Thiomonas sp. 13-66-29]SBP89642.1 tRNA pseudouridine synthase [Thiomonas delicata]
MAATQPSRWQSVHGVVLLDKPRGCTSQNALQQVRRALRAEKAGHTGTLDPLADGLLPLCFGAATKFAQIHLEADKAYRAVLQLGVTTTTDDAEGEVVERRDVPNITQDGLHAVLQGFIGNIAQTPPIYSALKRAGRPLYAYARAGLEVQAQPRTVRIDAIEWAGLEGSLLTLDVRCGKGTYIRALARDIGQALGCGAHLAALRRTASGGFDVRQACTLDALRELDAQGAQSHLLPVDCLVQDLPRVDLDMSQSARMLHGQSMTLDTAPDLPLGSVRLHGFTDSKTPCFLGIARWDGHALSPQRLLSNEELQHAVNTP